MVGVAGVDGIAFTGLLGQQRAHLGRIGVERQADQPVRGTITSAATSSAKTKARWMISCSEASSAPPRVLAATSMRSSSSECTTACSPPALRPSGRTTSRPRPFIALMMGRKTTRNVCRGPAAQSEVNSARCSATVFGASAPKDNVQRGDDGEGQRE